MTGKGSESNLPGTSCGGHNPLERTFSTYAEWLLWEATTGPRTSRLPPEEEFDFDDELFQQIETFNGEDS